jgi:Fic family protein
MTSNDTLLAQYPHMQFRQHWTVDADLNYQLGQCDAIVDAMCHAPLLPGVRSQLLLLSLKKGAQATTAIEGNTLTDEEVERIANNETLPPSQKYQEQEVKNVLEAFNTLLKRTVLQNAKDLISPELLRDFHRMIGKDLGEHFHAVPGQLAQSQRTVGPYRPPPAEHVLPLVERMCEWLREEFRFPNQNRFSDAIIQAIVTHVYIEWIHPFDDGNGRTGRLVEFYILMRGGLPSIASHHLANHYNDTRSEYYRQIQVAKNEKDLTGFLRYAVTGLRDGLQKAQRKVQSNALEQMWRVLVYDRFGKRTIQRREAFVRQREVALSLPLDRPIRFTEVAELTPSLKESYKDVKPRTVLRDLQEIEKLELITREPGLVHANRRLLEETLPDRRKPTEPATGQRQ